MATPFDGYEVDMRNRPAAQDYGFDLDRALEGVVALEARVPADAFSAATLGAERLGNGVVIGSNGLVLTASYLIMEAEDITLTLNDGTQVPAHLLGSDSVTGLGLVQALEPLNVPSLPIGDSATLTTESPVVIAGAGGRAHAAAGHVVARMPFAGHWEYLLENAIITAPAHPHWSGAALIGGGGELMGVGSLSLQGQSRSGRPRPINLFIPTELVPPIVDALARGQQAHPPRPWLGVLAQDMGAHVVLVGVRPQGPAARAELRSGDIILGVGGKSVSEVAEFYRAMWAQGPAGVTIPLRVQRESDVFDVEIRSVDRAAMMRKRKLN